MIVLATRGVVYYLLCWCGLTVEQQSVEIIDCVGVAVLERGGKGIERSVSVWPVCEQEGKAIMRLTVLVWPCW